MSAIPKPSRRFGRDALIAHPEDATVHVFHLDLSALGGELVACRDILSADEMTRAGSYAFAHLRRRFILRRGLLRRLLGAWVGSPPEALTFAAGPYGKPFLDTPGAPFFNLADCGDDVVVAVSRCHEVGIDLERLRVLEDADSLAAQCFSTVELAAYGALDARVRQRAFLRGWTSKEAVIKALGTGLYRPLTSFDVEIVPDLPAHLLRLDGDDAAGWSLTEVPLSPNLVTTLAVHTTFPSIEIWRSPAAANFVGDPWRRG